MSTKSKYWRVSSLITLLLSVILVWLWVLMNNYEPDGEQLVNAQLAMQNIEENWLSQAEAKRRIEQEPLQLIDTGIYIQSLQFFNSTDVNLSGYIWQHYPCDPSSAILALDDPLSCHNETLPIPQPGEVGFILPEQVNSGSDITPVEVYRKYSEQRSSVVIGWYFEATLRQPFEYLSYPFDHKTVWVRIWPKAFFRNVLLFPDYQGYDRTTQSDVFGIEDNIILGAWVRENTFFDYEYTSYDTDFGIDDYIGRVNFPELRYNFVVKRKFGNAFIVYLLPLFLVATLLFAAMLTVTNDQKISDKFGFNTAGFISASSALFFVVMLAHIQLREQFAGSSIVYIEYFYIIMYALLVITTTNTYLFSVGSRVFNGILLYEDNLLPKVCYWPLLISLLIITTLMVMMNHCSSSRSGCSNGIVPACCFLAR